MKPINFANLRLYRMYSGNRKLVQLPGLIRQWQERQRNKHLTKQLQAVQSLVWHLGAQCIILSGS